MLLDYLFHAYGVVGKGMAFWYNFVSTPHLWILPEPGLLPHTTRIRVTFTAPFDNKKTKKGI